MKIKKEKKLFQGVNIDEKKRELNSLINKLNIPAFAIKKIDYHENYNNLLDVSLEYRSVGDKVKDIYNKFVIKKAFFFTFCKKVTSSFW